MKTGSTGCWTRIVIDVIEGKCWEYPFFCFCLHLWHNSLWFKVSYDGVGNVYCQSPESIIWNAQTTFMEIVDDWLFSCDSIDLHCDVDCNRCVSRSLTILTWRGKLFRLVLFCSTVFMNRDDQLFLGHLEPSAWMITASWEQNLAGCLLRMSYWKCFLTLKTCWRRTFAALERIIISWL